MDSTVDEPEVRILKKGNFKKKFCTVVEPKQKSGTLEISDDEFEIVNSNLLGKRLATDRPLSDEATSESKKVHF